jgi:hypothetical protein
MIYAYLWKSPSLGASPKLPHKEILCNPTSADKSVISKKPVVLHCFDELGEVLF